MTKDTEKGVILSLGSVNADFQVRVDQAAGKTTTMLAHDFRKLSGGKAANVAYLACKLGAPAWVIGHIGDDEFQEQVCKPLLDIGVDLTYLSKIKEASTGVSMIMVPPNGKKNIVLATNANDQWEQNDKEEIEEAIRKAPEGSVLVVDYEVPAFIVEHAIQRACERNFPVILDPSPADRIDIQLFSKINYIVPDASETEDLTEIKPDSVDHAVEAGQQLIEKGVEVACVKLMEGGCVVVTREKTIHVPPIEVQVVDTTGAGDAFTGAFAVEVLKRKSLSDAACAATAASLVTVTAYGSQPAYPSPDQLQPLLNQVKAQIKIHHG